ncbi:phospholipid-transporting ATPase ABCA1-like [Protopterus annectens]|uniref:phospholipid-transporting ATPase ABCA1-like n=1 Tax=Protopterus annectens TaxID=7888 RepID=UPI001CF9B1E0|nr:phospholipid-transporting ATPase ABCA1-like [Protopterus annectens]
MGQKGSDILQFRISVSNVFSSRSSEFAQMVSTMCNKHFDGHYRNKALPSAGILPWLQGMLCNINNPCLNYPTPGEAPGQVNNFEKALASVAFDDIQRIIPNLQNTPPYEAIWNDTSDWISAFNQANATTGKPIQIGRILKENQTFTNYLQKNMSVQPSITTSIITSYLQPIAILNFSNDVSLQKILCNKTLFEKYVKMNSTEDQRIIQNISCSFSAEQIQAVNEEFLKNIDTMKFIMALPDAVGVKQTTSLPLINKSMLDIMAALKQLPNLKTPQAFQTVNSLSNINTNTNSFVQMFGSLSLFLCGYNVPFGMGTNTSSTSSANTSTGGNGSNNNSSVPDRNTTNGFCESIIQTMSTTSSLQLIWRTFRPLFMGKVLYTPDNPATAQIVKQANSTFRAMGMLKEFGEAWEKNGPLIWNFFQNSSQINGLRNMLKNPLMAAAVDNQLSGTGWSSTDLSNFLYNGPKEIHPSGMAAYDWRDSYNYTTSAIKTMTQFLGCLTLDKFEPAPNEWTLVNKSLQLIQQNSFWGGIVFQNIDPQATDVPSYVKYKIRMDIDDVERSDKTKDRLWYPGGRDNAYNDMRYIWGGFAYLQDMIDHGIAQVHSSDSQPLGVFVQQMPYPCYVDDVFLRSLARSLPMYMTLAWIYSAAMIIKGIVYEKEARLKEMVRMMGLSNGTYWLSWFISSVIPLIVSAFGLTLILKFGKILHYSDPSVLFIFLIVFCIATISECFFISVFFSKANLAAACGGIIYFVLYLPHVLCFAWQDYLTFRIKIIVSLLSTVAFGFGCENLSLYEQQGVGIQWRNIHLSPADGERYSFVVSMIMMLFDAFIYWVLTWYIENVFPGQYGIPKPWYFPFTCAYWCGASVKPDDVDIAKQEIQNQNNAYIEPEPSSLKQGVSVRNLVKIYKTGKKLAVDELSVNFYEGQITSFLGHNGAGKTTTMSILTGLFPPTSGTAIIYGKDIRTEMDLIRKDMGMCPQHNVLFEYLTVEEHIYFYARLKGQSSKSVKEEIDSMIQDVGLPHKRKDLVKNLSGGMQRKLSVAIAFVGGSKTVILDEPTAGVDPYARRGIWELLLKYKKDRTIILSTHHMDEADILGDRIAIISHGKLCCCGSSIFLKKCFGSGYYLTVVKSTTNYISPQMLQAKPAVGEDGVSNSSSVDEGIGTEIESNEDLSDKMMFLTKLVQKHAPEAHFLESIGQEITYILPYEGAQDGSFAQLFKELDMELPNLGILSYGVSDTTLEEIFLKVAEDTGVDMEKPAPERPLTRDWKRASREMKRMSISSVRSNPGSMKMNTDNGTMAHFNNKVEGEEDIIDCDGKGSYTITGWKLIQRQFSALVIKRFHHARRSRKGFIAQVVLPALFVCLALIFSMIIPPFLEYPSLELQPWMYGAFQTTFFSNDAPDNAQLHRVLESLLDKPGMGTRCMKGNPIPNLPCATNGSDWYTPDVSDDILHIFETGNWSMANPSPSCQCSTPSRTIMLPDCPAGAGGLPPQERAQNSTDILQNLTMRNVSDYLVKSYEKFKKLRYGGISVGGQNSQVQKNQSDINAFLQEMKKFFNLSEEDNTDQTLQDAASFIKQLGTKDNLKVWFYNVGWHAMASFINVANNAILRGNLPTGKVPADYGITTFNHPLNLTKEQLSSMSIGSSFTDVIVAICVIFAMSFIPASFVLFLIQERITKAKHLQFVSGVNPVVYWLANFAWDMCNYLVPCVIVIVIFLCFQQKSYVSGQNLPVLILLLLLYGWSITPLMYPSSFLFSVPSTAYVVLTCINLFIGINGSVATFVLEMFNDQNLININNILKQLLLVFPHFCLGRGLMDMAKNQAVANAFTRFGEDRFQNPFNWDLVGRNLFAMFIEGIGFFALTLLMQYKFFVKIRSDKMDLPPITEEDEDVACERSRIVNGGGQSDLLRIHNLSKVYRKKKKPAVNRICVGVPPAECFGLLGVNGAGKTTTFKMLTGDISVTSGEAFLNGYSILTQMKEVHQNMGYCPQFDAIDDLLNGQEHLEFYARLRGVPEAEVKKVAKWGIRKLGLVKYATKSAGTYSGGNKRKLSTAMALIGNPPIVFLDEPTTGMDPKARRFLWNCILSVIKEGRSVILTSHSMEECEALCTRMAIMVNGQFKCLGSIQHLKNRFGDGYTVIVKVDGSPPNLKPVEDFVKASFPGSVLKEKHHNTLHYQLPSNESSLSKIFSAFTTNKESLSIEDYTVSQTTLDQVFVNFAKHQTEEEYTGEVYVNQAAVFEDIPMKQIENAA